MNRALKVTIVAILFLVVIIVVVHPLIDLEPTVLRQLDTSVLIFAAVIIIRTVAECPVNSGFDCIAPNNSASRPENSLACLDLTCRRC